MHYEIDGESTSALFRGPELPAQAAGASTGWTRIGAPRCLR